MASTFRPGQYLWVPVFRLPLNVLLVTVRVSTLAETPAVAIPVAVLFWTTLESMNTSPRTLAAPESRWDDGGAPA